MSESVSPKPDNLQMLARMLADHFSKSELITLCHDLGIDPDEIKDGPKTNMVWELIIYVKRRGQLAKLIQACQDSRPTVDWSAVFEKTDLDSSRGPTWTKLFLFRFLPAVLLLAIIGSIIGYIVLNSSGDNPVISPTPSPTTTPAATPTFAPTLTLAPVNWLLIEPGNLSQLQPVLAFQGHRGAALHVIFSPDSTSLASSGADGVVNLWDIASGEMTQSLESDERGWTQTVVFSPNGLWLASGGNDKSVNLWDARSLQPVTSLGEHEGLIFSLAFDAESTLLASGDGDGTVKLWEIATRKLLASQTIGSDAILDMAFSPDGTLIAIANLNLGFKLLATDNLQQQCQLTTVDPLATSFSPLGNSIALGDKTGRITTIDTATCQVEEIIAGHTDYVNGIAFSPDGQVFISGSRDGLLFALPGQFSFQEHDASIESVAFSPDGRFIASADANGKIILWGVPEE